MPHRLGTLGGLSLHRPDGTPVQGAAAQRRRLVLYARLALAGDAGVARERLVGLLWPDVPDERARQALSQAVYLLRREVGSDDAVRGTATLCLDRERLAVDACELLAHLEHGRDEDAIRVYGGPFLDGVYLSDDAGVEHWAAEERQRLEGRFAAALERAAVARAAAGDREGAAAALAPSRADVWFELGDVYFHAGRQLGVAQAEDKAWIAFERALAVDSGFAPALEHLTQLAARRHDLPAAARYLARSRQDDSTSPSARFLAWRVAIAAGDARGASAALDGAPVEALRRAWEAALYDGEGADAAARALDALQRRAYFSRGTYFVGQELALEDTVATALRDTAAAGRARRHLAALADGTRKER